MRAKCFAVGEGRAAKNSDPLGELVTGFGEVGTVNARSDLPGQAEPGCKLATLKR